MDTLGGEATDRISNQVGVDTGAASKVISGALPLLLGAMSRNSRSGDGASALAGALDRDHDGSILDDVAGFLGKGPSSDGAGILGHLLGAKKSSAEAGLGKMSGLDAGSVGKILTMVAPLVMGALGREKRRQNLDPSALARMLGQEEQEVEKEAPGAMGLVGNLLDADGDGNVMDDVLKMGGDLLGGLFGGKK
jgi:hypothetical protein